MARVHDISETGLIFLSERSFPVGTEISLRCWVDSVDAEPVEVKAVVRRNQEGMVALEFLNLRRADRLRILEAGIVQLSGRTGATPSTGG